MSAEGLQKSQSFVDVRAVDVVDPPTKRQKREISAVASILEGKKAIQEHENETAEIVIVCEPEQSSLMMGGLHPRGSLYERPVNIDSAKAMHGEFRKVIREHGVKVLTVREILAYNVESTVSARVDLENLAFSAMKYELADKYVIEDVNDSDRYYLSDEYKREVVEHMSCTQLIDTVMINPTVSLKPSYRDTGLTASYTFEPLSNLVYTRDQQITTGRGIVMGRLRSAQRAREVQVMRFCFTKLGLNVIGEISSTGYLEGGDFFPMGTDLALLGIGLRSNFAAAEQLMKKDLLGSRRFGVVRDDFDQNQDRMHLDCVFSLLSDNCCIMLADIMGEDSPKRRLVDEYVRQDDGSYTLVREGVEFSRFMKEEGFSIIPISHEDQLQYGCNILNLGDSRIIGVHARSARQIVNNPSFTGDFRVIDFSSITSMYGSVHCASQVVKRIPRRVIDAITKK
uniref:Arginine deiminase n=1 Tax=Polytomella parva TaxID=51329 RepID=A0A7S0UQV8_9CHLO|mmetsp:Transcript_17664/g.32343  ORF Transcript_17664/g.32343 Transcript_17664/m.32343 type:complete len:454 (+) Transcript_17664:99-1460(+)|eukprot:CAMPEP_0175069936 /NCGR_PEP_ID=MMETSP0052_2-20121109/18452_1 /TAXON_ID=51329 ORGANISM="Polytomella parva, Strain SAG 63-3" /NCGR_SAMPLE_ID=MMETSP0052_2 /ASSEMBLY_ACC=CAM_ASM_000194 /LENGTH=453 /DNA_ID=CAMNT_0016337027 /DNA_START=42 /DNA_END=1403 /DNA_ORIENTATION=-